jgi:RNA polymerase sigma factor (sigma-70 family)
MADAFLRNVVRTLRRLAPDGTDQPSDGHYLDRFVRQRDDAAFEVLVWRHGQRVWNVCRRVLTREADVEDAFQATFLTFVRKAGTISNGAALGSWLHKVALRTALAARAGAARRALTNGDDLAWHPGPQPDERDAVEAQPLLDEEVNRLPPKYRLPIVLCYREGKTLEQAARDLGCGKGTLGSRLARARKRLRSRLTRRGVLPGLQQDRVAAGPGHDDCMCAPPQVIHAGASVPTATSSIVLATGDGGWSPHAAHVETVFAEPLSVPIAIDTARSPEIDSAALRNLLTGTHPNPFASVGVPGLVLPAAHAIVTALSEASERCFVGIETGAYPGIYRGTTADIDASAVRFVGSFGNRCRRCAWCRTKMAFVMLPENGRRGICGRCVKKMLASWGRRSFYDAAEKGLVQFVLSRPWLGGSHDRDMGSRPLQYHRGVHGARLRRCRIWSGTSRRTNRGLAAMFVG